jgi:succinate dehydrogenase / fumarate reductase cytochrome b subunit
MSLALLFLSKKSETTFAYLKVNLNELNFLSFFVYLSFLIFFYHLLTGIRHLLQDLHIGDSMNMLNISARGIIVIWLIVLILVFTSL